MMKLKMEKETDRLGGNWSFSHDCRSCRSITHLGIEISFGIMKFYESRFTSLSFGTLSVLTISTFNHLPQWLDTVWPEYDDTSNEKFIWIPLSLGIIIFWSDCIFTDEKLVEAQNSVRTNQSISRNEHLI